VSDKQTKYRLDREGFVANGEPVERPGTTAPEKGPSPREAYRLNAKAARSAEVKARRTAIIRAAVEKRKAERDAERAAAVVAAREQAGEAREVIETGWAKASDVVIPEEYQRVFDENRAWGMALAFSWRKFRSIDVNRRPDGTLAMVNGQHRTWAAQVVYGNDVEVPCTFTHAATTVEEADDFVGINGDGRGLTYNAGFRARVHAQNPVALKVVLVLQERGLRPLWPKEAVRTPATVRACRTIEYQIIQGGISSARAVLSILHEVWADNPEGYRDFILAGLWQFLLRYDGMIRRDRIVKVLASLEGPGVLDDLAAENRTGINSSIGAAACLAVCALYNHNEPTRFRLTPPPVENVGRTTTEVKRLARRWKQAHEEAHNGNGSAPGARASGVWAPGSQPPHAARRRETAV